VAYLRTIARPPARVLVLGEPALRAAVARAGFTLSSDRAAAVVVGLDRRLTYEKLVAALAALRRGAAFIATNPDPMLPAEHGLLPGAGSIVAALRYASGREPVVIGKPNPRLLREAMRRTGTRPNQTAMVGDQRSTDIAAGRAAGTFTILVLTGVDATRRSGRRGPRPDLIVRDLAELRRWLDGRLEQASPA
jgi:4-nitrophenyl phosphatase